MGIYLVAHVAVTCFRAFQRAQKYRYYYLSKGVLPFPRSFVKRVLHVDTFIYAALVSVSLLLLIRVVTYVESMMAV